MQASTAGNVFVLMASIRVCRAADRGLLKSRAGRLVPLLQGRPGGGQDAQPHASAAEVVVLV